MRWVGERLELGAAAPNLAPLGGEEHFLCVAGSVAHVACDGEPGAGEGCASVGGCGLGVMSACKPDDVEVCRPPWYVPMGRGDVASMEAALRAAGGCFAEAPEDFEEALTDTEYFWCGLPWLAIASFVRVHVLRWRDSGLVVPRRVWRGMQSAAMRQVSLGRPPCESCEDLRAVLLGGGIAEALANAGSWDRLPCSVCGATGEVCRATWLSSPGQELFCKACGLVRYEEYEVERRRCFDAAHTRPSVLSRGGQVEDCTSMCEATACQAAVAVQVPAGRLDAAQSVSSSGTVDAVERAAKAEVNVFDLLAARTGARPNSFCARNPEEPTPVQLDGRGHLYIGGRRAAEDAAWLRKNRVGLVVSVLPRHDRPRVPACVGKLYHFDCDRFDDKQQWNEVVDAVKWALAAGESVLVHCSAGIHRAPMCSAGILAVLLHLGFDDAYAVIVASGRYVEPHMFKKHMEKQRRGMMRAIIRVVTELVVGQAEGGDAACTRARLALDAGVSSKAGGVDGAVAVLGDAVAVGGEDMGATDSQQDGAVVAGSAVAVM